MCRVVHSPEPNFALPFPRRMIALFSAFETNKSPLGLVGYLALFVALAPCLSQDIKELTFVFIATTLI
jgi:hypothetical protein